MSAFAANFDAPPSDRAEPVSVNPARGGSNRLRTIATLMVLGVIAPLNGAVTGLCWIASRLAPSRSASASDPKTVLITGGKMTKALQLARAFHSAGHRVVLTETAKYRLTGHRFSDAVSHFATVPEPTSAYYADALRKIVIEQDVDLFVPVCSPLSSRYDSLAVPHLEDLCETVHLSPDWIDRVDDKYRFANMARALGLAAPKSIRITDPAQVESYDFSKETRPFILKSIAYDAIRRLDLTFLPRPTPQETSDFVRSLPISESNPWVMQEFIEGTEYCTHGTVRDGKLTVHIACESSPFQINYDHLDRADIREWIERFVDQPGFTGQVSLDFIEADDDGRLYAIECNPRTHSAITLFKDQGGLPDAYLGQDGDAPLEPAANARPTYWLYHELFRLVRASLPGRDKSMPSFRERLRILRRGRDAVFDWRDPLPFFMLHHVHIPSLLLADLKAGRGWHRIDFNIGKLVQDGGD